jgi:Integrase core domain
MADWAGGRVGLSFIPPGEPWRNSDVESFNSRTRDECLNINIFWSASWSATGRRTTTTAGGKVWLSSPCRLRSHLRPPVIDAHRRGALFGPTGSSRA